MNSILPGKARNSAILNYNMSYTNHRQVGPIFQEENAKHYNLTLFLDNALVILFLFWKKLTQPVQQSFC